VNPARHTQTSGVIDIGWYRDRIGSVDVVLVHGKMTEGSFDHFLAEACRSIDECRDDERVAMFLEARDPALMDGRWRKRLADALKARHAKLAQTRPAYAMVTPSLLVRSALTVVHWTAPPPYPHVVVSSLAEGFSFIARHVPGLHVAALRAEYERRRSVVLSALERG